MTFSLIMFIVSLLLISIMLWSKNRELIAGKAFVQLGTHVTDKKISAVVNKAVHTTRHITFVSSKHYTRKVVVVTEKFFMNLYHRATKKFVSVGDRITGHHLPKNRGSASFFLKNIEEHKKALNELK